LQYYFFPQHFYFPFLDLAMTSTVQIQSSWGDDDASLPDSEPEVIVTGKAPSESGSHGPRLRISYTKHSTTYAKTLYDVEGHVLVDERNAPVNLFTREMKDLLSSGKIICCHSPGRPGHRYFCTNKKQGESFRRAKRQGYSSFGLPYHIYEDEPGTVLPYEGGCPTTY